MRELVIMGAGGFARETAWLVEELNRQGQQWKLLGFVDEDKAQWGRVFSGVPVLGGIDYLERRGGEFYAVCAVARPCDKKKLVGMAAGLGCRFATLVHPDVRLSPTVQLGQGVIVGPGCLLTTNIMIGDHVGINPGCGIGHDAVVGAYSTLMWHVNLSGASRIGEGVTLGTKATVLQGIRVGEWATVGAGAVVTRDLPEHSKVAGVPARQVAKLVDDCSAE